MSVKRKDFTQGEETFARAAYDVLQDMEMGSGVGVQVMLLRTQRKGVFTIEMVALLREAGFGEERIASVSSDWPNASSGSLGSHMFTMANKLSIMVENAMLMRRPPDIWK